jgi:hypothetical protein
LVRFCHAISHVGAEVHGEELALTQVEGGRERGGPCQGPRPGALHRGPDATRDICRDHQGAGMPDPGWARRAGRGGRAAHQQGHAPGLRGRRGGARGRHCRHGSGHGDAGEPHQSYRTHNAGDERQGLGGARGVGSQQQTQIDQAIMDLDKSRHKVPHYGMFTFMPNLLQPNLRHVTFC